MAVLIWVQGHHAHMTSKLVRNPSCLIFTALEDCHNGQPGRVALVYTASTLYISREQKKGPKTGESDEAQRLNL